MSVREARDECAKICTVHTARQVLVMHNNEQKVENISFSTDDHDGIPYGSHHVTYVRLVIGDRWGGPPAGRFYAPSR